MFRWGIFEDLYNHKATTMKLYCRTCELLQDQHK